MSDLMEDLRSFAASLASASAAGGAPASGIFEVRRGRTVAVVAMGSACGPEDLRVATDAHFGEPAGTGSSAALHPGEMRDRLQRRIAEHIVRSLAASDPNFRGHDPQHECSLCGTLGATAPADHAETCPWQQARAWVAARDVDPEVEPPLYDDGPGGEPWQRRTP